MDNLENNKTDLIVSTAKSIVGLVPIAGSILSELVENLIPNQRIDRLSKFVKDLDKKLSEIPIDRINRLLVNEEFIDLIEEGFFQASRAITDDRRAYIASIISNGIKNENIKLIESKYLLKILEELNDIEVIWLRNYLDPTLSGDLEFRDKHKEILTPIPAYLNAEDEIKRGLALQNSYKAHLESLKLIQHKFQINSQTGLPEFDRSNGQPKVKSSTITTLGKILLKQIGLVNEI